MKRRRLNTWLTCLAALAAGPSVAGAQEQGQQQMARQISQHGITWTFDREYEVGQFVTGDWWAVGPVTVVEVDPAPGPAPEDAHIDTPENVWGDTSLRNDNRMRHGSMIVLEAGGRQGYDSRSQTYDESRTVRFPIEIDSNRSLVSTISNASLPVANFPHKIMWDSEKQSQNVLKAAAVLTVLDEAPPADAFRPPYAGFDKPIYRASDLQWDLLLNLEAPSVDEDAYTPAYELRVPEDWEQMERYFERPWLEHVSNWQQQQLNPNENQPNYGREHSRLVSIASLMLLLDEPRERKEKLLIGLVQYGIDNWGVAQVGASWNWGGGHTSGRKWPVLLASLMLDAPELRDLPGNVVFHEDAQTYYGTGWAGQTALYWMVQHHGRRDRYEHKHPSEWERWDRSSESYRICCNARAWVGTALAVRLMGQIELWNHDAYFDYVDRWMAQEDPYAEHRGEQARPSAEGSTFDPFVDAMWHKYRDSAPEQPMAGDPRMFVWHNGRGRWVPNPKPSEAEVAEHVRRVHGR